MYIVICSSKRERSNRRRRRPLLPIKSLRTWTTTATATYKLNRDNDLVSTMACN